MSYESIEAAIEDYESQLCACEDRLSRLQAENERRKIDLEEAYKLNAELGQEYKAELSRLTAENTALKGRYALLEECSPPDWPRPDFVKHLFDLWQSGAADKYELLLEATRWIPVGERLPEEAHGRYLVIRQRYEDEPEIAYYLADVPRNAGICGWERGMPVTHWMPIPPLPEEAQNE